MIRFLLVLLALVSALLAFIFQETILFVASGGLLLVSVVLLLIQGLESSKRRNRLKLPNDVTPEDELRARGVLAVRPRVKGSTTSATYAPPEISASVTTEEELKKNGIFGIREKAPANRDIPAQAENVTVSYPTPEADADAPLSEIPWSLVALDASTDLIPEPESSTESTDWKTDVLVHPSDTFDTETKFTFTEVPEDEPAAAPLAAEGESAAESPDGPSRRFATRRRVEVDAHLPALQTSLGAHTICLIDVDTDISVYRLRSIVSAGQVDHAGTEYPFAGFFLSDLLAQTSVLDIGPTGLALSDLRYHRGIVSLKQVVAAPVMKSGLPAAFLVAGFETPADESCQQAVARAAAFFSSLYALQGDHPTGGDSPLVRAKRKPPSLRLVKSNPKSSQSKIIAEEMSRARGKSHPLAFALVCLDKGDEISRSDKMTVYEVEEWMRTCLEEITPDGRIEYLGELGYGILQLRDVTDVEGWVRRAQQIFRSQNGPVDACPIVGVAMLCEGHREPEDLQADAVRALRAAYETGHSTILVG